MARTLCVLGGTGFLGVHVVRAAVAAGFRAVAVARAPSALPREAFAGGALVQFDATDAAAMWRLVEGRAPFALVNCAAMARLDDCDADPAGARRLNTELPGALARLARERDLRLVHLSTDLVFGARTARAGGNREDDETGPTSRYGRTKLDGERAVLEAGGRAVVARLPLLCGDSLGRGLGASDSVRATVARGARPRLYTDEWRTPLDVEDAARALVELATLDVAGVLHVAGPARMSRYELGLRALRAAGHARAEDLADPALRDAAREIRPADASLDASRARALLRTALREPFAGADGV